MHSKPAGMVVPVVPAHHLQGQGQPLEAQVGEGHHVCSHGACQAKHLAKTGALTIQVITNLKMLETVLCQTVRASLQNYKIMKTKTRNMNIE